MKTVVFYYVRHGKTEFNKQGIMQGQVDSPLVKEGLPVLERDAFVLKDVPFQRCFSSPLYRAVNTAEIILKDRNIPIEPLDDLIEMNFGDIDGKPHKAHMNSGTGTNQQRVKRCYVFLSHQTAKTP